MSILGDMVASVVDTVRGLGVTLVETFRRPITVQYPDERLDVGAGYRGVPVLVTDPANGEFLCTACMACVRICPPQCITLDDVMLDGHREMDRFTIDMGRCMECNLCVESCNFDALVMAPEYEAGAEDPDDLLFDKDRLAALYQRYYYPKEPGGHYQIPDAITSWLTGQGPKRVHPKEIARQRAAAAAAAQKAAAAAGAGAVPTQAAPAAGRPGASAPSSPAPKEQGQ